MILFHGTSSRFLKRILKHGLTPRSENKNSVYEGKLISREDSIYLTDTYALQFANLAVTKCGGNHVVVMVKVDDDKLLPDTDFEHTQTGINCLKFAGTCRIICEKLEPLKIWKIKKRELKECSLDTIKTGLQHVALGKRFQEQQSWILMCADRIL